MTRHPNTRLMLAPGRRRWANISPALDQCLMFAGAACDCTMDTAGQTDMTVHRADKGKPTCPDLCVRSGRHN